MRRTLVIWLTCAGLGGMSCHFGATTAPDALPAPDRLAVSEPSVSEPDAAVADEAASEAADVEASAARSEAEILAHLRSRHTALADHELVVLARTIVEEATAHGLDPSLVMAVIDVESGGYHLAVSPVGAMGLMQLMPRTGEELAARLGVAWHGPKTLFDPVVNVRLGTAYLRQLTDRYDHMPTALAAYNWGPGRIDSRIRRGASVPSRYIEQVMSKYELHAPAASGRS